MQTKETIAKDMFLEGDALCWGRYVSKGLRPWAAHARVGTPLRDHSPWVTHTRAGTPLGDHSLLPGLLLTL